MSYPIFSLAPALSDNIDGRPSYSKVCPPWPPKPLQGRTPIRSRLTLLVGKVDLAGLSSEFGENVAGLVGGRVEEGSVGTCVFQCLTTTSRETDGGSGDEGHLDWDTQG